MSKKLQVPIRPELIKSFLDKHLNAATLFDDLEEQDLYVYNLILRRIKLAENLRSEEVYTYVNKGVGLFEEAALRLHLFLSCIETIGHLIRDTKYVEFSGWLNAKKEPYKSEKEHIQIKADSTPEEIAQLFHSKYLKLYGVKTHFNCFFHDALTYQDKIGLLEYCWVLEVKPLPYLYDLQSINVDTTYEKEDWKIAAAKRKAWNILSNEDKLDSIAKAMYAVRNQYTHALVPYSSVQDKTPTTMPFLGPNDSINRGDTIFVWEKNIAISFSKRPTVDYVHNLVLLGLKNHINKKYLKS